MEETHVVERRKWDWIAQVEAAEAALLPPYPSFWAYAEATPRLAGVTEFFGDLSDKPLLEYGCGLGKCTVLLAKAGAAVSAFDLSPGSVSVAATRASSNGYSVDFAVAAGEELPYDDASFDVAFGVSVLHHLDVGRARPELLRVLAPGGKAAFVEPMGMNPLVNFARDHVPYRHKTPRGVDRPLTYDDIHAWGVGFSHFSFREVELLAMLERLFGYDKRIPVLHRLDRRLLEAVPRLRRHCRSVVLYMTK